MKIPMHILLLLVCFGVQGWHGGKENAVQPRTFSIDYENDRFLMDGRPFRYIAGSMHYFRVPRVHWEDRFDKMVAAGLNAVETYIEWSQHEMQPGQYNFDDNLDFEAYLQTAQAKGLYVILRAGPFICAERDMGGLPYWLLREAPEMKLRTNDTLYVFYVNRWLRKLLPMIKPHLYVNGGPIITVQVENEYGSYYACDWNYMEHLRDLFRAELGPDVVLFTTDGGADFFLKCGKVQGLYATVDFGPDRNVTQSFEAQRTFEPHGPLVNSEYYTGGHTHWGYGNYDLDREGFISALEEMLELNASISMYMFHGGTSFGFTNGANIFETVGYVADLTSYDFGAPVTESGHMTELYFRIRDTLAKYAKRPLPPVPAQPTTDRLGNVQMTFVATLFDIMPLISPFPPVFAREPLTFEELSQAYGFVMYETRVPCVFLDPEVLTVPDLRDRGYVYLDYEFKGILSRTGGVLSLPITAYENQILSILVENQGRINVGSQLNDSKGLLSAPRIGETNLTDWTMTRLPLSNVMAIGKALGLMAATGAKRQSVTRLGDEHSPAFYVGEFTARATKQSELHDTFLLATGWHKGIAILNGFNLGRYWPRMGPQVTLYVPKSTLRPYPMVNTLIMFELQHSPCWSPCQRQKKQQQQHGGFINDECVVNFIDYEILNGTTAEPYQIAPPVHPTESPEQLPTLAQNRTDPEQRAIPI